jgi:hypothetical protein
VPLLFGTNDTVRPAGTIDTLEGNYSAGAGTGISNRIPILRVFESWSDVGSGGSFTTGSRTYKLFAAGHELIVSWRPPDSDTNTPGYVKVSNGSMDTAIDALGTRINNLPWNTAVSGTQPGVNYNGNTPKKIRICFHHEPDNDTVYGSADQFKAAYRHFMARIVAIAGTRVICLPIFTGQANNTGKATQFYPGNTADDYVHELGIDPYFSGQSATKTFSQRIKPWQDWRDLHATGRKICVCETSGWTDSDVTHHVTYMSTIIDGMNANPDVTAVCWFSGAASSPSAIPKASNSTVWQQLKDTVDAAWAGTPPVDHTPPQVPIGLSATQVTSTTVTLAWQRPTAPDLAGYKISRDGAVVATVNTPATLSWNFSGQTAGSSHAYRIAAFDNADTPNQSTFGGPDGTSVPLTVTHPQVAEPDPPAVDPSTAISVNGHDVALAAVVSDPAAGTITVTVDWGDGNSGTGANATHNYATAGDYQVTITARSSASGKSTVLTLPVVIEDEPVIDRTDGHVSLWLPQPNTRVGAFGPQFRDNLNQITDAFETLLADRYVQNGDDAPIPRLPVLSVTGATFTDEDPSDDYPKGRTLLAVTGTGGGTIADGSVTLSKLAFDVATQSELTAGLAAKMDVGSTDVNKVSVGTIARSQHCQIGGLIGASFDPAAMANNTGWSVAAGTVVWAGFVAEISGNATEIRVIVATAGSGTGYVVRLHDHSGISVATATGVDAKLTSTGVQIITIASTALTRGLVYYVSVYTPPGVTTAPSLRASWMDTGMNLGGATGDRAGSATVGSAPTTLPFGSATLSKLIVAGVK